MDNKQRIQFEILCSQSSALFDYYNRSQLGRWEIGEFEPMVIDGNVIISYLIEPDPKNDARRKVTVKVNVEGRNFRFYRDYSYGVPLGGGVVYNNKISPEKDLIDLEYALSIATEHMASQIAKRLE